MPRTVLGLRFSDLFLLGLCGCLPALQGCGDEDPLDGSKVDPKSVWVDFAAEWQETSNRVGLSAQFRLKGPGGQIIKLGKGASVGLMGPQLALAGLSDDSAGFGFDRSRQSYTLNLPMPQTKPSDDPPQLAGQPPALREETFVVFWRQSPERAVQVDVSLSQVPSLVTDGLDFDINRTVGLAVRFAPLDDSQRVAFLKEEVRCELRSMATSPQPQQSEQDQSENTSEPNGAPPAEVVTKVAVAAKRRDGCAFDAAALRSFALGPAELTVVAEQVRPVPPLPGRGGRIVTRSVSRPIGFVVTQATKP